MKQTIAKVSAAVGLAAFLAGCSTSGDALKTYSSSYTSVRDAGYQLPTVPAYKVPKKYHRQRVRFDTDEKPGTIIVDTGAKFLYLVEGDGKAMRYGIGVGRDGFEWSGTARVGAKREWPRWTPPPEMIGRQPELIKYKNGMDPGLSNPLGARALYLYQGNKDTLFRIHGTNQPEYIGASISSGCIRMLNEDVIDLYNRVKMGTLVVVLEPKHGDSPYKPQLALQGGAVSSY